MGTGAATLTGLLQGNGASAITGIAGTAGQFPYYNGTNTVLATSSVPHHSQHHRHWHHLSTGQTRSLQFICRIHHSALFPTTAAPPLPLRSALRSAPTTSLTRPAPRPLPSSPSSKVYNRRRTANRKRRSCIRHPSQRHPYRRRTAHERRELRHRHHHSRLSLLHPKHRQLRLRHHRHLHHLRLLECRWSELDFDVHGECLCREPQRHRQRNLDIRQRHQPHHRLFLHRWHLHRWKRRLGHRLFRHPRTVRLLQRKWHDRKRHVDTLHLASGKYRHRHHHTIRRIRHSANNGTNYPGNFVFNIASSTASATTTLFSIDNKGNVIQAGSLFLSGEHSRFPRRQLWHRG